jgi:ABC-type transporter Mla subunit MlaD
MRGKRLGLMAGTKLVLGLALMLPAKCRGPVEYRALAALPDVKPGTSVTLAGMLIGRVVTTNRHGDTTVLRIWFDRGAERLPGSDTVQLRRMGLEGELALEMQLTMRPAKPFARGGLLHVLPPWEPMNDPEWTRRRARDSLPWTPPMLQLIPQTPVAPRRMPPAQA